MNAPSKMVPVYRGKRTRVLVGHLLMFWCASAARYVSIPGASYFVSAVQP